MSFLRKHTRYPVTPLLLGATLLFVQSGSTHAAQRHLASRASILRTREILASRSALPSMEPEPTTLTGRLGMVTLDDSPINAPREQYGRLLSRCPKGTYLVVTGETDDFYSVVMVDHSVGLIAKSDVQLMDYQISQPVAGSPDAAPPLAEALVQTATEYLKVPYVWGGNTAAGIDCSGLVKAVYHANGLELPRTAAEQSTLGFAVPQDNVSQWQPGDRMYFQCHHDRVDHAGMYIGNGWFIHSSIGNHGVAVNRVDTPFYWQHLVAVRRSPELLVAQTTAVSQQTTATPAAPDFESGQQ